MVGKVNLLHSMVLIFVDATIGSEVEHQLSMWFAFYKDFVQSLMKISATSELDTSEDGTLNREQAITLLMKKLENKFKLWGGNSDMPNIEDNPLAEKILDLQESMSTSIVRCNLGVPVVVVLTKTNDLDVREVCEEKIDEMF
jgi:hypothetical protein